MPPKRSIIIEPRDILAGIIAALDADLAALRATVAATKESHASAEPYERSRLWQALCEVERELEHVETYGIRYDVARFLGRQPTPTERVYCQRAIRALEVAGHVERCTVTIWPTEAGRQWLAAQGATDA